LSIEGAGHWLDMSDRTTIFVLFGATGDLSRRMVLPAVYDLFVRRLLPEHWALIGNGRGDVSHDEFRDRAREAVEEFGERAVTDEQWREFADRLWFAGGGFSPDDPGTLLKVLDEVATGGEGEMVHYLALPPSTYPMITEGLASHRLLDNAKVVYEKPYGESLKSFRELDDLVHSVLDEDRIYRIDHFLGKEATQNLHVLRFGNTMINKIWSAETVDQVQIDAPETLDVDERADFYDATGGFKDMIATHLFQVAGEVAMEPPADLSAAGLQAAREEVLAAFRDLDPDDVVLGQYDGYRDVDTIADDSVTDTYAAVRLFIDTDRWRDVPFVLRSGKQLAGDHQLVTLIMKDPSGPINDLPGHASRLEISLAGSGTISASLVLKRPGPNLELTEHKIDLSLADVPDSEPLAPYVSLLYDVLAGDRSLFTSSACLEQAWRAAEPIVQNPPEPISYPPGSWGPPEADQLTGGFGWISQQISQPQTADG
jgi:glucose-6-phosphate 1-dehydrogenase